MPEKRYKLGKAGFLKQLFLVLFSLVFIHGCSIAQVEIEARFRQLERNGNGIPYGNNKAAVITTYAEAFSSMHRHTARVNHCFSFTAMPGQAQTFSTRCLTSPNTTK